MHTLARCRTLSRTAAATISRARKRLQSSSAEEHADPSPSNNSVVASTKMNSLFVDRGVPVEKRSLSRGLVLNKFEKDFMIFPEYADTDDVRNIDGFVSVLAESLERSVDERAQEKAGELSEAVLTSLQESEVYGCFVPTDFGGSGMTYKDLSRIYEVLSADWSVATHSSVTHIATTLLLLYGNDAQKEKYLPLIASGKCRPAIAFPSFDGGGSEVSGTTSTGQHLQALDVTALNAEKANLIFIFAHSTNKERELRCYLIDRTLLREGEDWATQRDSTLVSKVSVRVNVSEANAVGGSGLEIWNEALSCVRLPIASAAIGYGKRVLSALCSTANSDPSPITPGYAFSAHPHIHRLIAQLSLHLYSLESVVYYIAGLLDEKLPVVVDVENALLHTLTRSFLRQCTTSLLEVLGGRAIDTTQLYEKHIRDTATLMALMVESDTVEQVSLSTISTWTAANMEKKGAYNTLRRLLSAEKTMANLRDPKLQHFIAEHAHPSLQLACQELEHSIIRLHSVLHKLMGEDGKQVQSDYQSLERIVNVLQNNLVMVCCISRASRSYSIGLRKAEEELAWATWICSERSRDSWLQLDQLADFFGLIRLNSSLLNVGRSVLDSGGYNIENPIQRNW